MALLKFWSIALLVLFCILFLPSFLNIDVPNQNLTPTEIIKITETAKEDNIIKNKIDSVISLERLFRLSTNDLRHLFKDSLLINGNIKKRIEYYSELGLETPYMLSSLGEGPLGLYDKDPLIDLTRVDCMTFCEQILALSIAPNYDEFFRVLQKIRYTGDIVNIKYRNHFVIADWLPDNNWLVEDITGTVGTEYCEKMTKIIHRRDFIKTLGVSDSVSLAVSDTLSQLFVPKKNMIQIKSAIESSDIVCIATNKPGLFVSHMGFYIKKKDQQLYFRNASSSSRKVVDESYTSLHRRLLKQKSTAGIIIFRVRPNFTLK